MGYRLHSASKYDVKYSAGDFNHKCEEIHNLLSACGADYTGDSYDSEFEVSRRDWEKVIEKLKNLDSLPEEEKDEMADFWKEDYKSELIEKLSDDGELFDFISAQNVAIEKAKKMCEKNPSILNDMSIEEIVLEELMKILEKNEKKSEGGLVSRGLKNRGSGGNQVINIDDIPINQNAWNLFKSTKQKGYILINNGSASTSSNFGHASLVCVGQGEDFKQDINSGVEYVTITSFPHGCIEKITWTGQIHGVQYEPYKYWVGLGAARNVKMYAVKKDGYVVKGKKIKTKKANTDLNASDYKLAVEFAVSQLGKAYPPYKKAASGKDLAIAFDFSGYAYSKDVYYCSSLVRAAFLAAVPDLDLDPDRWSFVSPADIAMSQYTRQVASWRNY